MIKVNKLFYSIDNIELLKDISLNIKNKNIVGIIGANGSGKSTLLKNVYRFLKADSGEIFIKDKNIYEYKNKDLAKEISVLTQKQGMNFNFLVEEIMDMGSYAHEEKYTNKKKRKIIEDSLSLVGMKEYIDRDFFSLSGGEVQRVLIARTIFQGSEILILDEPTNHLDIKYQIEIMNLLKTLNKTILMVLHDINLASYYCDYVYAMKKGKILYEGSTDKILDEKVIKDIYGVECNILEHPIRKKKMVIF
ncbi:MAG: ABC transporter ATP-binding protein [Fusobacterium sp.]|nr:ABC transporter ATP-binding protein [Fusobacterium sp.]